MTHTHPDHSPAAAVVADATGAELIGRTTADDRHQDLSFQPASQIDDDECIAGQDWTLRAIRTPGMSIITSAICSKRRGWSLPAITS
ncbi:MAG: hypothetical protein CM15mP74_20030 [Halieaceae bacterium]|nr:MAG: hypothetical protein CM15mP74_20030 [Halieaceae bacterium]